MTSLIYIIITESHCDSHLFAKAKPLSLYRLCIIHFIYLNVIVAWKVVHRSSSIEESNTQTFRGFCLPWEKSSHAISIK